MPKTNPNIKTWLDIAKCYSSLSKTTKPIFGKMALDPSHYHCERWRNSVMSPFFINPKGDFLKQLKVSEKYFKGKSKYHYDAKRAYVNILGSLPKAEIKKACLDGWEVYKVHSTLNVWRETIPLNHPEDFYFSVGSYFNKKIYKDFLSTMKDNFKVTPKFMRELDLMMKGIEENIQTVVLYHNSGSVAGAGLVATRAPGAFLFCGSINRKYRGRGLWNYLVSARQLVSKEQGARIWITSTSTKEILGKGELSYRITVLSKDVK